MCPKQDKIVGADQCVLPDLVQIDCNPKKVKIMINTISNVCVVGWGRSGISLCELFLAAGKNVSVIEQRPQHDFDGNVIDRFQKQGVAFSFGGHYAQRIKQAQLLAVSPGVDSVKTGLQRLADEQGIALWGELECAAQFSQAKIVAVTGTNGKSTTTFLIYRVLHEQGYSVFLGGNIGIPFSSFALKTKPTDVVVLEVSSFQLETISSFRPDIGVLLNVSPDHLDRYDTFSDYLQAKLHLFRNQTRDDWAVIGTELKPLLEQQQITKGNVRWFSSGDQQNANVSCVGAVADIFNIDQDVVQKVLSTFSGLPHRLQRVKAVNDVIYINDSKATNPESTLWALRNIQSPINLIAGGKDKGVDYTSIIPYIDKVKKIFVIGEAADKIMKALGQYREIQHCDGLDAAVHQAAQQAQPHEVVLLSPMCASFDMFKNYRERGQRFCEIVEDL